MPEIESRILGKIEVSDDSLYHLNGTILAFEDYDEFYLVNMDKEGTFKILQSKDNKNVCFILIDPFLVFKNYEPDVHDDDIKYLGIENKEDLYLLTIVSIPNNDLKTMSANLVAPVVFNIKNHKAKQCTVSGDKYTTRHSILLEDGDNNSENKTEERSS
ncbi:flagellar assembly protein FliW [uncultured Brachyspira sp.]|uniref:flagellar assembly protein FliW n=1 Tax=uncultured Brachyspira sp. TaxID=221953 RepID=UPI002601A9C3|nr:flagellar assembly protein FliW [uncultured Brachyspira sp.]